MQPRYDKGLLENSVISWVKVARQAATGGFVGKPPCLLC